MMPVELVGPTGMSAAQQPCPDMEAFSPRWCSPPFSGDGWGPCTPDSGRGPPGRGVAESPPTLISKEPPEPSFGEMPLMCMQYTYYMIMDWWGVPIKKGKFEQKRP